MADLLDRARDLRLVAVVGRRDPATCVAVAELLEQIAAVLEFGGGIVDLPNPHGDGASPLSFVVVPLAPDAIVRPAPFLPPPIEELKECA